MKDAATLRWLTMAALLLGALSLAASPARATGPAPEALYKANCAICHGDRGDGKGPAAVALQPAPPNFRQASWWESKTDAQLVSVILNGKPGSPMVGAPQLTPAQAQALVTWLRGFPAR